MYNILKTILKHKETRKVLMILSVAALGYSLGDDTVSALVTGSLYVLVCIKEMLGG